MTRHELTVGKLTAWLEGSGEEPGEQALYAVAGDRSGQASLDSTRPKQRVPFLVFLRDRRRHSPHRRQQRFRGNGL